jgi:hypothetical protein
VQLEAISMTPTAKNWWASITVAVDAMGIHHGRRADAQHFSKENKSKLARTPLTPHQVQPSNADFTMGFVQPHP